MWYCTLSVENKQEVMRKIEAIVEYNFHHFYGEFNLANGVRIALHSTAYGDGTYQDQQGRDYPVDAGLIGCIRVEDVYDPEWYLAGMNVVEFDKPFQIVYNHGVIKFVTADSSTIIEINTAEEEYA